MKDLLELLTQLKQRKIHYTLAHHRDNAIMVSITVPSERWGVEFFANGQIEVEVFRSGAVTGGETLERLFREFGD